MRVLLLNIYFHPDPTGTGLTMGELSRGLVRLGHDVTVVTTIPHYGLDAPPAGYGGRLIHEESWEGVRVLRTAVYVPRRKTLLSRVVNFLSYALLALPAGLRGPRPDIVLAVVPPISTGLTGWLVSRLRRAPLALSVQDVYPDAVFPHPWLRIANRFLERFVLGRAAKLIALSEGHGAVLAERGVGRERTEIVPMWTDLEGVRPGPKNNPFRAEHAAGASMLAVYSGNLGVLCGASILLEAAHLLREDSRIRFLIVGRGNGREGLLRQAASLGLPNVTFLPTQPRERLPEMLAAADVGLVTLDARVSVTSVPSKTFTIMAAGRPVVAALSDRNEVAQVVRSAGCGVVVSPSEPRELAETLRAWTDDPSRLGEMGERGRAWAERFHDRDAAVRAHARILSSVARGQPGG